jgi:hypothetical protein
LQQKAIGRDTDHQHAAHKALRETLADCKDKIRTDSWPNCRDKLAAIDGR